MDATQHVLTIFERLSAIPRGSGNEAQVSLWLQDLARQRGFPCQCDEAGSLVIRVPATPGREAAPVIVLQGHMDMVCEKTPDSTHNFLTDPIRCIADGDWLKVFHYPGEMIPDTQDPEYSHGKIGWMPKRFVGDCG